MIPGLPGDIFRTGQVLNNTWTIEGVLGRGGTGEVYRAKSTITGRVVAVKALSAQFTGDAGYLELMRREEAMRDIVNDAVVRYSECSRTPEGHVFLVMDYIDGPALSEVLALRRLPPRDLLILAHRLAEGLVAAHARGVIHRDISPDNVILRGGKVEGAVLIDFGIAKDTAAGARTVVGNQFAGKYEYAAPEQFDGKALPASDIYALGATLAAAARGNVPFAGATPAEMMRRKAEPLDTSDLPEPLAGLIRWLCAPRLADRAPSAAVVVARLDALLKGPAPAAARRQQPAPGRAGRAGRGRAGMVLALLLALVLLAGGGIAWQRLRTPALPLVQNWQLLAQAGATPRLSGQAPDADSAARIAAAFAAASGSAADAGALTLARGMPAPGWAAAMVELFPALAGLGEWTVSTGGLKVTIAGAAPSDADREAIAARLQAWAQAAGLDLDLRLSAPELLLAGRIDPVLAAQASCGPLASDLPAAGLPPEGSITITGNLPDAATEAALLEALRPLIGAREVRLATETLSPTLCQILSAMAGMPDGGLSLRLSEASRPEASLTGIYRPGDNPVADALIPAALAATPGAELWAAVEADGTVYNILPNMDDTQAQLAQIGQPEGALQVVRLLWPPDAPGVGKGRFAFRVNDKDFGKTGVFALVSQGPLFPDRRPGDESAASFAEALARRHAEQPGLILGATWRIMDLRP